jgi:hypothetical protein
VTKAQNGKNEEKNKKSGTPHTAQAQTIPVSKTKQKY